MDLDVEFEFRLAVPGESLDLRVNDLAGGEKILLSTLQGVRRPLTDGWLAWFALKYPWLTLWVIVAVHWQALRLCLKGVPWKRKGDKPELQRGRVRHSFVKTNAHAAGDANEAESSQGA